MLHLLKRCQAFANSSDPRLLNIQPSYVRALVSDDNDLRKSGLLIKRSLNANPEVAGRGQKTLWGIREVVA